MITQGDVIMYDCIYPALTLVTIVILLYFRTEMLVQFGRVLGFFYYYESKLQIECGDKVQLIYAWDGGTYIRKIDAINLKRATFTTSGSCTIRKMKYFKWNKWVQAWENAEIQIREEEDKDALLKKSGWTKC